jgi:hypothetical protein
VKGIAVPRVSRTLDRLASADDACQMCSWRQEPKVAGMVFCRDWLLGGYTRTFSPFYRGVVTPYALEVGAAGEGDNRHHPFSAFRATRDLIHEVLPVFSPLCRFFLP